MDSVEVNTELREIISLHRQLGEAEGLLTGWLYVTGKDAAHLDQCRSVTRKFLGRAP